MHMVNHMGHYPQGAGPSRVDSLISEHEDNPDVEADELSSCIFNAPNVQVRFSSFLEPFSFHAVKSLSVLRFFHINGGFPVVVSVRLNIEAVILVW